MFAFGRGRGYVEGMPTPAEILELLAQDPDGHDRDSTERVLAAVETHRSWVSAREAKWARHLDGLPRDSSSPAKDLAGEMQRKQKVGAGQAKRRAERAKQLEDLPETEQALEDGDITDAHADVLARARAKADAKARATLESKEAELLAKAALESPYEFAKRVDRFVQQHSADDGRSEWDKKKARQRLTLSPTDDGMTRVSGLLAPELAQRARRVLGSVSDELYRRDHQNHPTDEPVPPLEITNEQRQADALEEILRRAEQVKGAARNEDRAVVVLAYDDLVGRDGPRADTSTLWDGTPVPASVARRMACDAGMIPLVLGGKSCQLDLGRAQRIASPSQRSVLFGLWSTCSFADCTAPVAWSEMHHTIPFEHDGPTDIADLSPACRSGCHDLAHAPGWSFTKNPDDHSTTTIGPDGRRWHRMPTGPPSRNDQPGRPRRRPPNPGPTRPPPPPSSPTPPDRWRRVASGVSRPGPVRRRLGSPRPTGPCSPRSGRPRRRRARTGRPAVGWTAGGRSRRSRRRRWSRARAHAGRTWSRR